MGLSVAMLSDGIFPYVMGGIQKFAFCLGRELARQGVEVTLMACDMPDGGERLRAELGDACERCSVTAIDRPRRAGYPGHYLRESFLLSRAFRLALDRAGHVDIVYAHGFTGWAIPSRRLAGGGAPLLGVHLHGLEMFQRSASARAAIQNAMLRWPARRALAGADLVFSFGGRLRAIVEREAPGARIASSNNAIDRGWLAPDRPPSPRPRFAFVGRYERRKGVEELFAALASLGDEFFRRAEFHVVGPIPERVRLAREGIIYHGPIAEESRLKALLAGFDVLVCPSWSEGMPTVILEAMASGMAVIATDVGAVGELMPPEAGWLIPPADGVALRSALETVAALDGTELRIRGRYGRELVARRFLWEQVAAEARAAIEEAIAAP